MRVRVRVRARFFSCLALRTLVVLSCPFPETRDRAMNYYLDHEKLDVYRLALQFVVSANQIVKDLPRGGGYLADQLRRAGSSIALNIAEGAGEFSPAEKVRFYRMAKRSATECSSILDVLRQLELVEEESFLQARELVVRTVAMLIKMVKGLESRAQS